MQTLSTVTAALAALDFSDENSRIAEIEARIAGHHDAVARAEERVQVINETINPPRRSPGEHEAARPLIRSAGDMVADALVLEASATAAAAAAPSREALEDERASLREGIRTLIRRVDDDRAAIDAIRREAMGRVRDAVAPLAQETIAEARASLAALPVLFATLTAINGASTCGTAELAGLRLAVETAFTTSGFMPAHRAEAVPDDIVAALNALAGKGVATGNARFFSRVALP